MTNEIILREFIQKVWNEKDYSAIETFVHPEYRVLIDTGDPWEGKVLNHQEFATRLHYSFDAFPDLHFDIREAITDGDYVAIHWVMTGTNLGNIGMYPPTGKSIKTFGCTIYQFCKGKVCGHAQVFDRTIVMKQLGFLE